MVTITTIQSRPKKKEFGDLGKTQAERLLIDRIKQVFNPEISGRYDDPSYISEIARARRDAINDLFDLVDFNKHAAVKLFKIEDLRPIKLMSLDGEVSLGRWAANWHEDAARQALKHKQIESFWNDLDCNDTAFRRAFFSHVKISEDIARDAKTASRRIGGAPLIWNAIGHRSAAEIAVKNPDVLKIEHGGTNIAKEIAKLYPDLGQNLAENEEMVSLLRN